ncbi:hypothetical protein LEP1GSC132_4567 [Leptospira kirschneri str. 200803703]|uniref:Uncharacterized protein n=2 Tax=Leptospira kirschneri TaxID=29507 RepID=A0A0E2B9Z4_9LEPT|nr:hypothetical protein LEP1GSC081_0761 [Leptospira kirschneri str. H1]EMK22715.1 hypothetical protein LEP1GSC008_0668 [Leptospira kirschneri serovar Bulgarica str. Nikolaevo]EMO67985.1 hypothetical protein LEP1GSC132_4567 [Leptospira kirschneri str. 200803703]
MDRDETNENTRLYVLLFCLSHPKPKPEYLKFQLQASYGLGTLYEKKRPLFREG